MTKAVVRHNRARAALVPVMILLLGVCSVLSCDGQGQKLLSKASVARSTDIDSVVIRYCSFDPPLEIYKVTSQSSPQFIKKLYKAMETAFAAHVSGMDSDNRIMINLKDGSSLWCSFSEEPFEEPRVITISRAYIAPGLLQEFQDLECDSAAAALDARIGDFTVRSLVARVPGKDPFRVPVESEHGQALIAKAKSIVDWLDLRGAAARVARDVSQAEVKFGTVMMYLAEPVEAQIMVWDAENAPYGLRPKPFAYNISFQRITCNIIKVMDYGNFSPPVVVLVGRKGYVCPNLTRRDQERHGVEKHGWQGHSPDDADYYKQPKVLYSELRELTEAAHGKYYIPPRLPQSY